MFGDKCLHIKSVALLALLLSVLLPLSADDASSGKLFSDGLKAVEAKDYIEAAELFARAEREADSIDLKLQAAMREADSYRSANYRGKEFETLERIIKNYPTKINFGEIVDREYAIGDAYFHGYADPMYWSLRFIPWLTDKNRMDEIYQAALKHAPYAPAGATARLRLAINRLEKGENEEALKLLREIIRCYPDTESARFAMLELGNALSQMALTGDGDSKHFDEAIAVFEEFSAKYPDLSENEWVKNSITRARSAHAERLYGIADFYRRDGKEESAIPYLLEVMRRFPDTEAAIESEKMLTKLDKTYYPEQIQPEIKPDYPKYEMLKFPSEPRKLLLAPQNSNGKFLLPIYDLNLNKEKK